MNIQIHDKEFQLLLEYDQIKKRSRFLAIELDMDYEGRVPVFIGVLNGSFIFMADLLKETNIASEVAFVKVASYQGNSSTGQVRELIGLTTDIKGRDVILVEDIVDTGLTLRFLIDTIQKMEPASVAVCTLLFKPKAMKADVGEIKYTGFEIPNEFVVGYGLDYDGLGRNLKDIYRNI